MKIKSQGILKQMLDDELIINNSERDQVHVLNETAVVVWNGLERGLSSENIENELKQLYNIGPEEDIKKQIQETLLDFKNKGLTIDDEKTFRESD